MVRSWSVGANFTPNGRQLAERGEKQGGFEERGERGGRCFVEDGQIPPFEESTMGRWRVRN